MELKNALWELLKTALEWVKVAIVVAVVWGLLVLAGLVQQAMDWQIVP